MVDPASAPSDYFKSTGPLRGHRHFPENALHGNAPGGVFGLRKIQPTVNRRVVGSSPTFGAILTGVGVQHLTSKRRCGKAKVGSEVGSTRLELQLIW